MRTSIAGLLVFLALTLPAAAQGFDPPVAVDVNPDPTIVEVNLSANVTTWQYISGVDTTVWAYSDDSPGGSGASVPGPTIKANVGDTLRVHFTNNLPEPTTIHWHGIENYADMDGSHISQLQVPPGGTFEYEFPLLTEGLYWYHPHVRTFDQVEKGLHAGLLVKDPAKDAIVFSNLGGRPVEEHIVFFDDILLDANDQVVPAFSFTDPLQNALYHLNGRVGNLLLVNGKESSGVTLPVTNGAIQNWYIVNAANTTFCRLEISKPPLAPGPGVRESTWEIGSDGGYVQFPYKRFAVTTTQPPAAEHPGQTLIPEMYAGVLCFPGERMQVAFTPSGAEGETFTIRQWDWFRGRHLAVWNPSMSQIMLPDDPMDGGYPTLDYFDIKLVGQDPGLGEWIPKFFFPFPSFPEPYGLEEESLPVTFGHGSPDANTGAVTLFAQSTVDDNGAMVPLPAKKIGSFEAHDVDLGSTRKWEITNLTHGDHPFHTHGFFFELIEMEWIDALNPANYAKFTPLNDNFKTGAPNPANPFVPPRKRKDTIRVPARLGAKGTSKAIARLRVVFDDTGREGKTVAEGEIPTFDRDGDYTAGGWLFHCHILEHSAKGMLSFIEVRDPEAKFENLGKHLPGKSTPYLTGRRNVKGGISLELVNAKPVTGVFLIHSNDLGNNPFAGGTLVPLWNQVAFKWRTNRKGEVTWNIAPGGVHDRYWQVVYRDDAAPEGWSMSNALMFR
jgi:FtsP/CotA-like multicopper oxidase with cupredoxin domain